MCSYTNKPTDILLKLPTKMATEKSTKKSTTKSTKKSTKSTNMHWNTGTTGISLRQKTFIGAKESGGKDDSQRS